jgi:hypothetical protein
MTDDDWRHQLKERHADLFGWGGDLAVGSGWRELIEKAVERIAAAVASAPGAKVTITQIKEKFGGLRIYFDEETALTGTARARVEEAIALAEARADCTCETCGAEGRLYIRGGWYLTCCEIHAEGEPVCRRGHYLVWRTRENNTRGTVRARRYDRECDAFVDVPIEEAPEDPE